MEGENHVKEEIYLNGPILIQVLIDRNFLLYKSGVIEISKCTFNIYITRITSNRDINS